MCVKTLGRRWRTASLLPFLLVAACAGHTKFVTITTVPPGAMVELNGRAVGEGPFSGTLDFSRVSVYEVVASKDGYERAVASITLEPKSLRSYVLELTDLTKTLSVTSDPPGAAVHLDGEEVGMTPWERKLSFAGTPEHLLSVTKDGFMDGGVRRIRYEPRDSTAYHFILEKKAKAREAEQDQESEKEIKPLDHRFRHPQH